MISNEAGARVDDLRCYSAGTMKTSLTGLAIGLAWFEVAVGTILIPGVDVQRAS